MAAIPAIGSEYHQSGRGQVRPGYLQAVCSLSTVQLTQEFSYGLGGGIFAAIIFGLVINAPVEITIGANRPEFSGLLLADNAHVLCIFCADNLIERELLNIANSQRCVNVPARTGVDNTCRHYLNGIEEFGACSGFVHRVRRGDVDVEPFYVFLGDISAPIVVDAMRGVNSDPGLLELLEQGHQLA